MNNGGVLNMAKPNNAIATVKLPGDTNARPIIPYYVGYASNNNYVATLPQLTSDAQFIINKLNQTIGGTKSFSNTPHFLSGNITLYDTANDDDFDMSLYDDCLSFYSNAYDRGYD